MFVLGGTALPLNCRPVRWPICLLFCFAYRRWLIAFPWATERRANQGDAFAAALPFLCSALRRQKVDWPNEKYHLNVK